MNKKLAGHSALCHLEVKGFSRLKAAEFEQLFSDEVAELDEIHVLRWQQVAGLGELIELSNGYCVHVDKTNRWSLFETEAHYTQRTLHSAWAAFVRGCWSLAVPCEPGVYFVKDRDLGKRTMRELVRVNGRLRDISGGMVQPGRVTTWCGYWWTEAVPQLPESY